jgi:3-oxoacyl-[acyl-carrier protein] reductase
LIGLPGQTNYAASKAGIIGFTKALAKEVGPYNIRVNAIAPGFIETDMLKTVKRPDEFLKWIPLARFGEPKEVAEAVLFLASDYARYITGQVIRVDGGLAI